jgi:hypothetical protein
MDHEDIENWVYKLKDSFINQPVSICHRNMHRRFEVVVELNFDGAIVNFRLGVHFKLAIEQIICERGASLRGLVWVC